MNRVPIPQPPHSAGTAYKGLRASIDPQQIPSQTEWAQTDQVLWRNKTFPTLPSEEVPLAVTDYISIDQGNSSPRFIRPTVWNFPKSSALAAKCQVPLAAVIQPFADQEPSEEPIPVVDFSEIGPPRCAHCQAYINPWCKWIDGGNAWRCNLCRKDTEVLAEYFSNLDANFVRLDAPNRPELLNGTIDFIVPAEYYAENAPPRITPSYFSTHPPDHSPIRNPGPMEFVFALDVSASSIESGFVSASCSAIREALFGRADLDGLESTLPCFPANSRVAIITFDRTLHFYDLSPDRTRPTIMVIPDVEEVFVPLRENLFVNPNDSRATLELLLDAIPTLYSTTVVHEAALGSALCGAMASLAGRGGHVVAFQSVLPTIGRGALPPRVDESTIYETDKEHTLFIPRDPSWTSIGEECAQEGIGVSMFISPQTFIDVASIGVVCKLTGGDMFFHPRFEAGRDTPVLTSQLRRLMERTTGYSCLMRVRASHGLRISGHYGNFYRRSPLDIEFAIMDADKAVSVTLEHVRSDIDDHEFAYLQSAVLYTSVDGQRRVRTCNLALKVVTLVGNVFKGVDLEAMVCHLMRESVDRMLTERLPNIRKALNDQCGNTLLAYRRNCAAATAPTQLILPEQCKLLPLFTLCIIKSKPLKGRSVTSDVRNVYSHWYSAASVRETIFHLYPRLLSLHDLAPYAGLPDPISGHLQLPSLIRSTYTAMEAHGVYLIDNGHFMVLWIGLSASPQLIKDLFDVDDVLGIDINTVHLSHLQTRLSVQVRNIISHRHAERGGREAKFFIARQNTDGAEIEFSNQLVEDQNNAAMSYVDALCYIHQQISTALKFGGDLATSHSSW